MAKGTSKRAWIVQYASERLRGRDERRRARRDLARGTEPAPRYSTGKQWND